MALKRSIAVLLALSASAWLWGWHQAQGPELLFTLGWGEEGLALDAGDGRPVRGPTAAALGADGTLWIVDDLAGRLLGFGPDGTLRARLKLPAHHHDLLAVSADGRFALYARHLARIELLDADGEQLGELLVSSMLGTLRSLAFADGELEGENAHGERFPLGLPDSPRSLRASRLGRRFGPAGSAQDCGLSLGPDGEVGLRWARLEGEPRTGREAWQTSWDIDLGSPASARLASLCGEKPELIVEIERVHRGDGLCEERELVQIREGRPIATWEIPSGWLYVPAGRLARADDGVVLIHPLEQGLQVWRWRMP